MSSYNENLNASVAISLQTQELKLSTTQTKLNAGMFTLYYAEDAKITAQEKLKKTEQKYADQETIKDEAVENNNLSTNLAATASQEKQFNLQSVANTATAAANVQIATNAIIGLASDIGSIVSILNAADYGSQIFEQTLVVNKLMNDTAYNAEVSSQLAMDASYRTAEVTANTVSDMAISTGTSITDLLTILNSQLGATTALQITENTAFTDAATAQKKAEGELIDANVEYDAAKETYLLSINKLNLNLQITNKSNSEFTVEFSPYTNPFYNDLTYSPFNENPVENYYVFVVNESEKSMFSIATAEGLIDTPEIAHQIYPTDFTDISETISINDIKDINNNDLSLGENYVVFVLVQFTIDYKKTLNNFEDYLTSASSSFVLTTPLNSPDADSITVSFLPEDNTEKYTTQVLQFDLIEPNPVKVDYRCMFLPNNSTKVNQMFKTEDLLSVEKQIVIEINNEINKIKDEEDEIKQFNNQNLIDSLTNELNDLTEKKAALNQSNNEEAADGKGTSNSSDDDIDKQISDLKNRLKQLNAIDLRNINPILESQNEQKTTSKPGFFFNQLIAENVTDGNYIIPTKEQITFDPKTNKKSVILPILENTTDNFGNPLIEGNEYIPVIVSMASGPKKITLQFSNSISDFKNTDTFIYATKTTENNN